MTFLPLHPERKLLTGCRHRGVIRSVYRHDAPPYIPLSVFGYPRRSDDFPIAYICTTCGESFKVDRYMWAFGRSWDLPRWSLMNPGA